MDAATMDFRPSDPALARILTSVEGQGLGDNLIELETQGYTILPGVLSAETVERARTAILKRVEAFTGRTVDPETATSADFNGMQYIPYLLYQDEVFEEILMEPGPLALITYLLGESCLMSSMVCHFRGPGGAPLMLHSDNANGMPAPYSPISMVANVNYALTPYSREAGALAMWPGSHRLQRQPTAAENFSVAGAATAELLARARRGDPLAGVVWREPDPLIPMDLEPGDAVVWHGNTWHGSYRREISGVRMNLSAYFCRQHIRTQELQDGPAHAALVARHGDSPRLRTLLGAKQAYGWREEGPDYGLMAISPRGLYD